SPACARCSTIPASQRDQQRNQGDPGKRRMSETRKTQRQQRARHERQRVVKGNDHLKSSVSDCYFRVLFLRAVFGGFFGSTTTKSASSHVKGGLRRRSACRRLRLPSAVSSPSRRSSVRRSQVTTTGSSEVRVFS